MSPFIRLFILSFLGWTAINSTALVPAYLGTLGASQTFIGFYNIVNVVVVIGSVMFFGRTLVRWPRLAAIRWGFVILALSSVASWALAGSLAALTVFRITGAAAQVFTSTMMVSLLLDTSPSETRAGRLSLFSVAGMLTNPLTALAGEAVLRTFGGPGLFLLSGAVSLVALGWSWLLAEPPRHPDEAGSPGFLEVVRRKDMGILFLLAFIFGIYYTVLTAFLPKHTLTTLGEANLSAFLVPFSAMAVGLRMVLGNQMDRRPPRRFLSWSFGAVAAAMGILLLPTAWAWLVAAGFLYGFGHSILYPILNTLFVQKGEEAHKSVYSNVYLVVNLLGAVVMTPLLGLVGDFAGFPAIAGILGITALGSVFLVRARFPKPGADQPSGRSS